MKNSQLIKENKAAGGYSKIYPLAYIQGVYDYRTKVELEKIIDSINHIYLPFEETVKGTRKTLPTNFRRKGIIITYKEDNELVTEVYIGEDKDVSNDAIFTADANWEIVPDLEFVKNNASKIPNGAIIPEHLSPALWELLSRDHIITNFPDEEDLTQHCKVLKFKDRNTVAGKGYKILRKNWVNGDNILKLEEVNLSNTIYEIRYDFDLDGQDLILPKDVTLLFNGGSFNNGRVICKNTNLLGVNKFEDAGNAEFSGTFLKGLIMNIEDTIKWYDGIQWVDIKTNNEGGSGNFDITAQVVEVVTTEIASAEAEVVEGEIQFKFGLPKGEKGDKGDKGDPGEKGKDGDVAVATQTFSIFKSTGESLDRPETPEGGYWNSEANDFLPPEGWTREDELDGYVWMSSGVFKADTGELVGTWSTPIRITGVDGNDGADGVNTEFIYKLSTVELSAPDDTPPSAPNITDYVPEGWEDHPIGVTETWIYEYVCTRKKNTETNKWEDWEGPALWSKWGANGKDGDGVEYIYQLTREEISPAIPGNTPAANSPTTNYQEREFLPAAASGEEPWTDNPKGVSKNYLCEWVSVRKFNYNTQLWGDFSKPALWAKYGEKGDPGMGINILGSYESLEALLAALDAGTLLGNNPPQVGDAYIVNGDIYIWDGDEFINGGRIKGDPGESVYFHIKYSDDGRTFTELNGEVIGKYIGTRVDSNPIDSDVFSDYTWSQFRGNDGFGYEYIFQLSTEFVAPDVPTTITDTDIAPEGWTDDPTGVDEINKYEWCCYRKSDENGQWGPWKGKQGGSKAWLFAMYAESVAGATGQQGPIVYPAGIFDSSKTYTQTIKVNALGEEYVHATPYVLYGGEFYLLQVPSFKGNAPTIEDGSWLQMDKFDAIYTDILLANNALVGSAVFNGDYMFSQQGITASGATTSAYDKFNHSDPYNSSNSFRPNWCVNLKTGEQWASAGGIYLGNNSKDSFIKLISENSTTTVSAGSIGLTTTENGQTAGFKVTDEFIKFDAVVPDEEVGGTKIVTSLDIKDDGSGSLANGKISWDKEGNLDFPALNAKCTQVYPEAISASDFNYNYIYALGGKWAGTINDSVFEFYELMPDGTKPQTAGVTISNIAGKVYFVRNSSGYALSVGGIRVPNEKSAIIICFGNSGTTGFIADEVAGGTTGSSNVEFVDSLPSSPDSNKLYVLV